MLNQVHLKKICNDWISQHLYFFSFLKKNTTTGSSVNFLSPESNGQAFYPQFTPTIIEVFLIWSKFQGLAQKLKDQPFAVAAAKDFKSGIPFKKFLSLTFDFF